LSFKNLEIAILPLAMKKFAMMKTSFFASSSLFILKRLRTVRVKNKLYVFKTKQQQNQNKNATKSKQKRNKNGVFVLILLRFCFDFVAVLF